VPEPRFFASSRDWRAWLEAHHDSESELWVGFYKVGSGRPSITWPESVAQALCFGWIDGVRRSVDADSYQIRFTPRRPSSSWSEVNLRSFAELERRGLVTAAGRAAHAHRRKDRSGVYSFENRDKAVLGPEQEALFRANETAWAYFTSRPRSYRTAATWWVVSAKREATRERRLAQLIADSAAGRPIGPLTRP
jgi:uncharacterized protein YdeI (YjbR/CyaY-like superfamily)